MTILITGATSGIGRAMATRLHRAGYAVIGTRLPHESDQGYEYPLVLLDVTSDEQVQVVVQSIETIEVLINNAGFSLTGAVEETSLAEAQAQFEVNFWGTVRMIKAVLPGMRQRRRGQIINMSSLLGIKSSPFSAFYAASKHAIEGYTKALRCEVKPLGIHVSMIEPGFVRTPLMRHGQQAATAIPDYAQWQANILRIGDQNLNAGIDPDVIAATAQRIMESQHPRLRYPVFIDPLSMSTAYLPDTIAEKVVYWLMGAEDWREDVTRYSLMGAAALVVGWGLRKMARR